MNMVDCPKSRHVAHYGRKNISKHGLPLQTALKNVIVPQNLKYYEELLREIKVALGQVSFIAKYFSTPHG